MPNRSENCNPSPNALKYYLKLGDLVGPIDTGIYEGWFPIYSFNWGSGVAVSSGRWARRRRGNNNKPVDPTKRTCSQPSYSEMTMTRPADGVSAVLMSAMGLHTCFERAILEAVNSDGLVVSRFTLHEVLISGFSCSGGDGESQESISFNYAAIESYTCSMLRTNLAVPSKLATPSSSETSGVPQPFAVTDIAARIFHFLETPELFNSGLSCKLFLRHASSPALKETIKNTVFFSLRDGDKSTLNGLEVSADPNFVDVPEEEEDD
eukprot:TRINITY_DN2850_c0_g1_i1.p1 TRINITY_DN2850_c0_g1~~TRINITY_DN2850_c0_g1_i1.p1  ORF type:complete len:265 (-),score=39.83 TRINITY_DN2850_c0_g1_i1:81-875(-)